MRRSTVLSPPLQQGFPGDTIFMENFQSLQISSLAATATSILARVNSTLRFVYTHDLDLAISLSDAISIEILPSFQIATAGDSDNILCFLARVNITLGIAFIDEQFNEIGNNVNLLQGFPKF